MVTILLILIQLFIIYLVYKLIFPKLKPMEGFCVSFLFFNGLISFLLFLMGWIGISITKSAFIYLCLILVLVSAVGIVLFRCRDFKFRKLCIREWYLSVKKMAPYEMVMTVALILLAIFILLINLYWPFWFWDVLALYDFRAKTVFQTGLLSSFTQFGSYYLTHPLFTSMTHLWLYLIGFQNVKFIYAIYYFVFGILFYNLLRKNISRFASLFFTFLLLSSGGIISAVDVSYSNLPYTVFFSLGALYLFNYFKHGYNKYLIISSLLLAFSVWSRALEPYWAVCFVSLLFFLYLSHSKKKIRTLLIFLLPIMVVYVSWNIFSRTAGGGNLDINPDYVASQVAFSGISDIFTVLAGCISFVYKNFISPNLVLFLSFIISLILSTEKKYKFYGLGYIAGIILISYVGSFVYYFMVGKTNWTQLGDSLFRMSVVMPPLLLYFIAENICEFVNNRLIKK